MSASPADTAESAVTMIADWWTTIGRRTFAGANQLLILCDGGGSNGWRHVMIWINHREPVVAVFVGSLPNNWMEIYGKGPQLERIGGWLVYSVEAHPHETRKSFHEEIIQHLTPADAILLLGLG